MGQHDDNDHFLQILKNLLKNNILDHATITGGNYIGPGPICPFTKSECNLYEQSQMVIYDESPTCMLKVLVLIL
jgi:hypothetical protein